MIPKIIHYCWFGKQTKPKSVITNIESWKKYLPDWKIIEWNEDNCDINETAFTREAYYAKKYAFVSDYFRFKALFEFGGGYFDTDVEICRSMQNLVDQGEFVGMEVLPLYNLGTIFVKPKSLWVKRMLNYYVDTHFFIWKGRLNTKPNTFILTEMYPNGSLPITVYPADFLCAKNSLTGEYIITDNTYCIHHFSASWHNHSRVNWQIQRFENYFLFLRYYFERFSCSVKHYTFEGDKNTE